MNVLATPKQLTDRDAVAAHALGAAEVSLIFASHRKQIK